MIGPMKVSWRSVIFGLVLPLGVVGAAYCAGKQGWFYRPDTSAIAAGSNPRGPADASTVRGGRGPVLKMLSRDEAVAKFLGLLAGNWPENMNNHQFYVRMLLLDGTINYHDIPDIVAALKDQPASRD